METDQTGQKKRQSGQKPSWLNSFLPPFWHILPRSQGVAGWDSFCWEPCGWRWITSVEAFWRYREIKHNKHRNTARNLSVAEKFIRWTETGGFIFKYFIKDKKIISSWKRCGGSKVVGVTDGNRRSAGRDPPQTDAVLPVSHRSRVFRKSRNPVISGKLSRLPPSSLPLGRAFPATCASLSLPADKDEKARPIQFCSPAAVFCASSRVFRRWCRAQSGLIFFFFHPQVFAGAPDRGGD